MKSRELDRSAPLKIGQIGINSADFLPLFCPFEILSLISSMSIEMETQQPPIPA